VRIAQRIGTVLIATVLTLAGFGLAVRIYMGREVESRLAAGEAVNLTELRSPLPKSSFLACPPHYCAAVEAVASPIFEVSWHRLQQYWLEVISGQQRVVSVTADERTRRFVYIERSALFRFPDIITVEFVPLGPDRSSVAILSRSRYGDYDFAKNRKRVERLLGLLQRVSRPVAPRGERA
jgi:uncharacterized protein (DUF1499 family)